MNAYEFRKLQRKLNALKLRNARSLDGILSCSRAIQDYEDAWYDLHSSRVTVQYKHGRYYVHGRSYFRSDLLFQTMKLQAAKHELELYAEV